MRAELFDAEPNDDQRITTDDDNTPAEPNIKISGNMRKFDETDQDLEPPSEQKKGCLKMKKCLKKLSF